MSEDHALFGYQFTKVIKTGYYHLKSSFQELTTTWIMLAKGQHESSLINF